MLSLGNTLLKRGMAFSFLLGKNADKMLVLEQSWDRVMEAMVWDA